MVGKKKLALILSGLLVMTGLMSCSSNNSSEKGENATKASESTNEDGKTYTIGINQLVQHDALDASREGFIEGLKEKGFEVVNTLFTDEWYSHENMEKRGVVQIPLCFLAKSLENMSLCHTVYFCKGWENARGCRIEHDAAVAYGLEIIYEN